MKFISLFSGVGGFDLGLERAGMECVAQVEIDEFCQKVLTKHWPDVPKFKDVRDVGKENLPAADLVAGGFPCQPFSLAGKQRGADDDRHLWPEMLRVITEIRPTWVVGENVPGIIPVFLDQAISDLEAEGYACEAYVLPACAFGAPHQRKRLFFISYAGGARLEKRGRENASRERENKWPVFSGIHRWPPEPDVGRVADGVPDRVDRLKSLGNAVVPQVAEHIGRMIMGA